MTASPTSRNEPQTFHPRSGTFNRGKMFVTTTTRTTTITVTAATTTMVVVMMLMMVMMMMTTTNDYNYNVDKDDLMLYMNIKLCSTFLKQVTKAPARV